MKWSHHCSTLFPKLNHTYTQVTHTFTPFSPHPPLSAKRSQISSTFPLPLPPTGPAAAAALHFEMGGTVGSPGDQTPPACPTIWSPTGPAPPRLCVPPPMGGGGGGRQQSRSETAGDTTTHKRGGWQYCWLVVLDCTLHWPPPPPHH
jgi:hypothetical protein